MQRYEDITGMRFGRLSVLHLDKSTDAPNMKRRWVCLCDCGNMITARGDCLKGGKVKSCGCYQREIASMLRKGNHDIKHGYSRDRLFNIWYLMKYRCDDESSPAFKNYGGRGITVCKEWSDGWISGYEAFKEWAMNNGYTDNLTLDRIDNNSGYSPKNCRWVSNDVQANNKRNNVLYRYDGKQMTLAQIAKEFGIRYKTLWRRIQLGHSIEEAVLMGNTTAKNIP